MAAIQGAVELPDLDSDQIPDGWKGLAWVREVSSESSLAVLASVLQEEQSDNAKFHWFEVPLPTHIIYTNAGNLLSTDTILTYDDGSGNGVSFNLRVGTLLLNNRTNELVRVTVNPAANTSTITVTRASGTTAAAAILDNDTWTILLPAETDSRSSPPSITTGLSQKDNYIQIASEPFEVGALASVEELRTGSEYVRSRRERFMEFVRKVDRVLIWGQPVAPSGATTAGQTGGLRYGITTYTNDFADSVSEADLDNQMERAFRYGSTVKLFMCGGVSSRVVGTLCKRMGQIVMNPGDKHYGLNISQYDMQGYTVQILQNAHMKVSVDGTTNIFSDWGFILDTAQIKRLYLRGFDLQLRENVKSDPSVLGIKDEWLGSVALMLGLELHHAMWQNMSAFSA